MIEKPHQGSVNKLLYCIVLYCIVFTRASTIVIFSLFTRFSQNAIDVDHFRSIFSVSCKYIFNCLVFYFISVSISSPCRKDQFAVFTFYLKICTDPGLRKMQHSSLVCRCGFAVIIVMGNWLGTKLRSLSYQPLFPASDR